MPEYRRFISYFYEYIDGKKQKNTGFAKVELRSGVWRILFRLTVPTQPKPPVEIFGFMREGERLTGLPMGTMRAGREMTEEWAYRADEPVWLGKYGIPDISGLWIRSGDGRCFATVWDDEPVDPAQFVKYEEQKETPPEEAEKKEELPEGSADRGGTPEYTTFGEAPPEEVGTREEQPGNSAECGEMPGYAENERTHSEMPEDAGERSEASGEDSDAGGVRQPKDVPAESEPAVSGTELNPANPEDERHGRDSAEKCPAGAEGHLAGNPEDDRLWRDLYAKRAGFQPFSDQEISSCIRVIPGDIVVLQNAHWRTGKNNFLLHGYYNYRHLLIGRSSDGGYVLGVPGIMNPQEKYMAAVFGFPDFKYADNQEGGASFGYWYRPLKKEIN